MPNRCSQCHCIVAGPLQKCEACSELQSIITGIAAGKPMPAELLGEIVSWVAVKFSEDAEFRQKVKGALERAKARRAALKCMCMPDGTIVRRCPIHGEV